MFSTLAPVSLMTINFGSLSRARKSTIESFPFSVPRYKLPPSGENARQVSGIRMLTVRKILGDMSNTLCKLNRYHVRLFLFQVDEKDTSSGSGESHKGFTKWTACNKIDFSHCAFAHGNHLYWAAWTCRIVHEQLSTRSQQESRTQVGVKHTSVDPRARESSEDGV